MTTSFSSFNREEMITSIENLSFDLLVIGGGITGAGIALDAATRGMKTVLLEMQDFAAGTSSRSTKLIHGGLRYLKQGELRMVSEVGKERAIVYENGPHVTTPEWMLLPIYKNGSLGKWSTSIGLMVYDYLAGVKRRERRKILSKEETLKLVPLLRKDGLLGSGYYIEYRTDDARLTIEVIKEAVRQGATALNYMQVEDFIYQSGRLIGVKLLDGLSGERYQVFGEKIVNATGPWVDLLQAKAGTQNGKKLRLTKGIHLVFDRKTFPLSQAIYFDTPDKRMMFAIPRGKRTYVGTTDTHYQGDIANPSMTRNDRKYVLDAIRFQFPTLNIDESHVVSSWAGLRPLIHDEGKQPSDISRKDEVWISDSGLITIAGGKLTGYRKMAEKVVDLVAQSLVEEGYPQFHACRTKYLPISGGDVGGSTGFPHYIEAKIEQGLRIGLTAEQAKRLIRLYGSNIDRLYAFASEYKEEFDLPFDLFVSLLYSCREEMVMKPTDFFIRRTGALYFNLEWVQQWKGPVIDFMEKKLKWTVEQKQGYTQELEKQLYNAVMPLDESSLFDILDKNLFNGGNQ